MVEMETTLTRREATLRSAATTSLAGIALVQAVGLPFLFAQGGQLAVLSMVAMTACVGLGLALAAAPADAARLERWLRYQIGFLEANAQDLRRRLRRRTHALVWVLVGALGVILVMAGAVLAARPHGVELPPLA